MVYFHRPIFTPTLSLYDKPAFHSIHYGTDTLIFTHKIVCFLVSDEMGLSVLKLLQPPRSQSLVDGFNLTGAEILGAAWGRGLGG